MNAPAPQSATPPTGKSPGRVRFAFQTLVLIFAVTTSCILAGVLGSVESARWDVTASREHHLSARSLGVLAKLTEPLELVVADDFAAMDRLSRQRAMDVLDKFSAASPQLKVTIIETASTSGIAQFEALLGRLRERAKPAVDSQTAVIVKATDTGRQAAEALDAMSASLLSIREAIETGGVGSPGESLRQYLEGQAATCRVMAADLRTAMDKARDLANKADGPLGVPALDEAARMARAPMLKLADDLTVLNRTLDAIAGSVQAPTLARDRAKAAAGAIPTLRDALARQAAELDALPPLALTRVARAIQRTRAVLVIGQPKQAGNSSVAAIDPDTLFGPRADSAPSIDQRYRSEELIAATIASFVDTVRPLVVFVHAAATREPPELRIQRAISRLELSGMDVLEWAAAVDTDPPAAARDAKRPVVFVTLGTEANTPESAVRMERLAAAIRRLIEADRNVLVSVNPSALPGVGAPDPMVEALPLIGIRADSGRVLMEEFPVPQGRSLAVDLYITDPGAKSSPIAKAIEGLRTRVPWAIPLKAVSPAPAGIAVQSVIESPARANLWAEAEWQAIRQTPPAQRSMMPHLPVRESPRNDLGGPGPWSLAMSSERNTSDALGGVQRVVVVGSNGWFFDAVTGASRIVDGREVFEAPGNLELLHASVAWLAHQEDRIARGAEASSSPTIPNLSESQITTLRWVLIGVLPVSILLLGAAWRVFRG